MDYYCYFMLFQNSKASWGGSRPQCGCFGAELAARRCPSSLGLLWKWQTKWLSPQPGPSLPPKKMIVPVQATETSMSGHIYWTIWTPSQQEKREGLFNSSDQTVPRLSWQMMAATAAPLTSWDCVLMVRAARKPSRWTRLDWCFFRVFVSFIYERCTWKTKEW